MSKHQCPPWCHKCPDMKGDVMPVCYGSVDRNDLRHCYCKRPSTKKKEADTIWDSIDRRLSRLEQALGVATSGEECRGLTKPSDHESTNASSNTNAGGTARDGEP